ncbi:alpha/beta hydrolase [Luteococcus japonicus]|uniref:Probable exported protease n=1 Tax=Luteococcus japonicus LSP_Lj1 TaxID=1255658 RepID=A0A1R4IYT4_9ACTN|nr:alpha/beta hydrolase [Luteococcus japonicus]SJN24533.1 probable exported protease [Luteococcus japonicus LSP_Lj1]
MSSRHRLVPAVLALGTAASMITSAAQALPVQPSQPQPARSAKATAAINAVKNPKVVWRRCAPGLQCGNLVVPLDYADMDKGTITLPVSRRPADQPKRRIGSLFTNPGGPGGASNQTVTFFANSLGRDVRARFDIVGVAPRGMDGEALAECTGDVADAGSASMPLTYPLNPAEVEQVFAQNTMIQKACKEKGAEILSHMSTADVARDMDLARRALGDKKITYHGVSYGSYLGATYAAMYPKNVRALVVDGVLDPVEWATGRGKQGGAVPVTERIGSGHGVAGAFEALLAECERVGTAACPEAGSVRSDWHTIQRILAAGPVDLGQGYALREDDVIGMMTGVLYSHEESALVPSVLHDMAVELTALSTVNRVNAASSPAARKVQATKKATAQQKARGVAREMERLAERAAKSVPAGTVDDDRAVHRGPVLDPTGETTPEPAPDPTEIPSEPAQPPVYGVGFHAVLCGDSVNPSSRAAWVAANDRVREQDGGFGQLWLWSSSLCAGWPVKASGVYRGSFGKPTSAPVLVMTTDHDPATPMSGAVAYRKTLKTSRLVTVKGAWAHSTLDISACSDKIRNSYLLTGKAPAKDVVCKPDHALFTQLG